MAKKLTGEKSTAKKTKVKKVQVTEKLLEGLRSKADAFDRIMAQLGDIKEAEHAAGVVEETFKLKKDELSEVTDEKARANATLKEEQQRLMEILKNKGQEVDLFPKDGKR
jgi:hypothetical protein